MLGNRRGAGVADRDGLENRCTLVVPGVRIPPSPFFLEKSHISSFFLWLSFISLVAFVRCICLSWSPLPILVVS